MWVATMLWIVGVLAGIAGLWQILVGMENGGVISGAGLGGLVGGLVLIGLAVGLQKLSEIESHLRK